MKHVWTCTIFLISLVTGFQLAWPRASRTPSATLPGENFGRPDEELLKDIESYLRFLPENDREAWVEYASRMSKIHSGSNETIETANLKLTQQPCFSDLAAEFYGWLLEEDFHLERLGISPQQNPDSVFDRPSLKEEAGRGRYKDIPPGSVWAKALEISGNEPNVALALIGLCGHDDAVAVKPELKPARPATAHYQAVKKKALATLREEVEQILKTAHDPHSERNLRQVLEDMDELFGESKTVPLICPSSSLLFVPKALGQEVDLDQKLKDKITRLQSPRKGAAALPAKAYHFIGSAMNACLLRAKTITSFASLLTNPVAARLYRGKTLASLVESNYPMGLETLDADALTEEQLQPIVDGYNKIYPDKRPPEERGTFTEEQEQFWNNPQNALANYFPSAEEDRPITVALARESIIRKAARADAAKLARKWWSAYTLPNLGKVYLPSLQNRPELVSANANPFWWKPSADRCEEKNWTKKRCERAIATLDTWEVDFKWTAEQHFRGALFGWRSCRSLSKNETLESLACRRQAGR